MRNLISLLTGIPIDAMVKVYQTVEEWLYYQGADPVFGRQDKSHQWLFERVRRELYESHILIGFHNYRRKHHVLSKFSITTQSVDWFSREGGSSTPVSVDAPGKVDHRHLYNQLIGVPGKVDHRYLYQLNPGVEGERCTPAGDHRDLVKSLQLLWNVCWEFWLMWNIKIKITLK